MSSKSRVILWDRCQPRTKIARWENALRVLESLTPAQRLHEFSMRIFGRKGECGTTACAAGYCALDPWFNKRGFKARWRMLQDYRGRPVGSYMMAFPKGVEPHDFFGQDGTGEIFYNGENRSVERVIQEVRNYLDVLRFELDRKQRGVGPLLGDRVRDAIQGGLRHGHAK